MVEQRIILPYASMLEANEAQAAIFDSIQNVRTAMSRAIALALDFKEREGWRWTGHNSFDEWVKAKSREWFPKEARNDIYRFEGFFRVVGELQISNEVARSLPQTAIRELIPLVGEEREEVWERANVLATQSNRSVPNSVDIRDAKRIVTAAYQLKRYFPLFPYLEDVWEREALDTHSVLLVATQLERAPKPVRELCENHELLDSAVIGELNRIFGTSTWDEIARSGHLHVGDEAEPVPISQVTFEMFKDEMRRRQAIHRQGAALVAESKYIVDLEVKVRELTLSLKEKDNEIAKLREAARETVDYFEAKVKALTDQNKVLQSKLRELGL